MQHGRVEQASFPPKTIGMYPPLPKMASEHIAAPTRLKGFNGARINVKVEVEVERNGEAFHPQGVFGNAKGRI